MNVQTTLIRAAENLLDFMSVRSGEDVLITTDTGTDQAVSFTIFAIAERLGADPSILTASRLPFQGSLADPYISRPLTQAVKSCDVWIDLTFPYLAGSHVHDAAMSTKRVRYILGGDMAAGNFERLFGMVDLDQYFEAQAEFDNVFGAGIGKFTRITTALGTDVTFELGKSSFAKPRRARNPGMYLVPGSCSIAPKIETVKGKIVVTSGFHEFYERMNSPITIRVDGKISELTGGGASRGPLDRAMLRAGGGEYGSVIHFTHGLHPAARFTGQCFIEDMRAIGSNAVGLGIPWWEPGGGENHPDTVLTEQSVWLDDEPIIRDGVIVAPPRLADLAAKLGPVIRAARDRSEHLARSEVANDFRTGRNH
jgi:2,5-dihydroxypyridine 5,6-dioxygenase